MKNLKFLFLLISFSLLVSCPKDDSPLEEIAVKPITYNLLYFNFVQQTDTNEDSLSYEIEYVNSNDFEVKGFPKVTLTVGDTDDTSTVTFTPSGNTQCRTIDANSSCILTYSAVDDNPGLFPANPIKFINASYYIE